MEIFRKYIYPVSAMAGGIIGVGIFSLPYVARNSGILLTLGYFLVLTSVIVVVHLVFAEISLKTPDFKRFPGFVGHHLGKWAEALALLLIIFGSFAVLLAYLIVGGEFLTSVFQPYFGGGVLFYTLLYFVLACAVILLGIKAIAKLEFWALILLLVSFLFIFLKGFSQIKFSNVALSSPDLNWKNLFLPYGTIIFALWGTGMIPEAEEMLRGNKKIFKKVVIISTLIPAVIYILFIFLVLGITGSQTTETALTGLKNFLGNGVLSIALFVGVLTTFVAFVTQGLTLRKVLMFDMGIKSWQAFIISCFTPLVLFLLGLKSFIPILSFTGGVLLGIDGILILLMYKKIGGKNYVIYPLLLIFLLGILWSFKF